MNSPNQKTAGAHHDDRDQSKQTLCEFQMGREEAGFPDRFLVRAVGDAARLLAGAGRSLSGWKLTARHIVAGLKTRSAGALWTLKTIQTPIRAAFASRTLSGRSASGR